MQWERSAVARTGHLPGIIFLQLLPATTAHSTPMYNLQLSHSYHNRHTKIKPNSSISSLSLYYITQCVPTNVSVSSDCAGYSAILSVSLATLLLESSQSAAESEVVGRVGPPDQRQLDPLPPLPGGSAVWGWQGEPPHPLSVRSAPPRS